MKTILVGTDFSSPAKNAVYYAAELAKFFSAKLVLVNAVPMPLGGYDTGAPLEVMADLMENSKTLLKSLKQELIRKDYSADIAVVSEIGNAFTVMKDVAASHSADMLVMGMVGEGGFLKQHLIGSFALRAARELTLPLFIVPETAEYRRIHHICFACDMDKIKESTVLYTAKYFATAFDAEIELVTVEKKDMALVSSKDEPYTFLEQRLENTKHKTVYIKDNNVARALDYYLKFHTTDLVMVNPKKHTFFETLFEESVTRKLAFSVQVPLLIVHG
ncbi:hypothetical protein CNR22_18620 [Sphingobacteriaceae bacterium]|nr:hypothetical protein CNR22_18620 [Sphingobacteriaceae bacterium]